MSKKIHSKDLHYNLESWIKEVLSKPNSIFNNLPACPYAKQAWTENKVEVFAYNSWIDAYSKLISMEYDFDQKDVYVFAFPSDNITPEQLTNTLDKLTSTWQKDWIVVLEDHPDELEEVQGFNLNFGKQCLLLVQARNKLAEARNDLEAKGYYKNWSEQYRKEVHSR
jgi:hypothetical protein